MDWSRLVIALSYLGAFVYLWRSWRFSKGLFGRPVLFLMMFSAAWWAFSYIWLAIAAVGQPLPAYQIEPGIAIFIRILHLHVALSYIAAGYFSRKWATVLGERAEMIAVHGPE